TPESRVRPDEDSVRRRLDRARAGCARRMHRSGPLEPRWLYAATLDRGGIEQSRSEYNVAGIDDLADVDDDAESCSRVAPGKRFRRGTPQHPGHPEQRALD